MIKKYKNKIIIAIIILIVMSVYIFITTWQEKTYQEVHAMYPLEKSQNPKASEEFLKAMEYRIYIKELHPYFDYNSFIIAPFLMKINYHFKRGKALLPKESVEDIVWWTLFYKEIYGLLVPPRNDNSMAYENLPPKEFAKVHDAMYRLIMRYPEGKVYFDIPEIKQFRFKVMAILVGFYYKEYSLIYDQPTNYKREYQENRDSQYIQSLENVKKAYRVSYIKYIDKSKDKNFMEHEYWSDMIYIITDLIVKYTYVHKSQVLSLEMCNSEDNQFILKHTDKLLNFVQHNATHQAKNIRFLLFNNDTTNVPEVLKLLNFRCSNLRPEITQVVQKVEQLNQKLSKKDK